MLLQEPPYQAAHVCIAKQTIDAAGAVFPF